jgi:FAD/FMN-containing dehydrogenase
MGLEAVLAPGQIVSVGGPIRKDVSGFDLKNLLIGSEGTLGIVTAAWLRLVPAPDASYPVAAFYPTAEAGCAAIESVLGNGLVVAALEYLDAATLAAAGPAFPSRVPSDARFLVLAEADGSLAAARELRTALLDVLGDKALDVHAPRENAEIEALWRWRDGVSIAVTAQRGGKVSEDIVVPLDRLAEAMEETLAIGARHGLSACSWGHAGDGTCMQRSSCPRKGPTSSSVPRKPPRISSPSPSRWADRSRASTASASASATGVVPGGCGADGRRQASLRPSRAHEPREEDLTR